ncbi:MAG: hypothetical protein QGF59_18570, partial [Pirellulaceae bacterium]|nr:hypothetical protein [Pirellulaceae bacterium]
MSGESLHTLSRLFSFAADEPIIDDGLHFWSLPANYVAWLFIPCAIVFFAWFTHRRLSELSRRRRWTLTALRVLSLAFVV